MKHITNEKFNKINAAAFSISQCFTGCRNKIKEEAKARLNLLGQQRFFTEVKKLPKEYKIIHKYTCNLGTKKYCDIYVNTGTTEVTTDCTVRETDKSIIIEKKYGKTIINKEKIIGYLW